MRSLLSGIACLGLLTACGNQSAAPPAETTAPPPALLSGIERQYADDQVRVQDDFYQHVNGKWLADTQIPADKASYDTWTKLYDDTEDQLHAIVDSLQKNTDPAVPDQKKIADLYASFMDETAAESKALKPLEDELSRIDAIKNKAQLPGLIGHLQRIGVTTPYTPFVHLDAKDSSHYVFDLGQDGLGMPDRDYYLLDDPTFKTARSAYLKHIESILKLGGDSQAAEDAAAVMALETALARVQWTKVENRDPVKTYNKITFAKLSSVTPLYDWKNYIAAAGVDGKIDSFIVSQPSYLTKFGEILAKTPLPVWKMYFRWQLLSAFAPYLNKAFVDEHFAFFSHTLRGIPENRPRWKRGLSLIENSIGEGMGREYVARYFPPAAKARMDQMVKNLLAAYDSSIDKLDWMAAETKVKAHAKLAKFTPKIGYPPVWRDYSTLQTAADDLVGNVIRAQQFEYERNLKKLGTAVDRNEWGMTPQTINAYYNPEMNEIVFPAAVLQPPFFDVKADDAANYGGIGAVIGHEISHGFDDQGSQYDGDGNLLGTPGWFSQEDYERFKAKTQALVQQYSSQEALPGYHVNGELTLGENIADNSGQSAAYKAYKISLAGSDGPVIDGLTGDQRFYMGWAQVWREKIRDGEAMVELKTDPHSPERFRGNLPPRNQDSFYSAFDVKPNDKMYLPPEQRVHLW